MNPVRFLFALAVMVIASPALAQYVNRTIMYFDSGHGTQVVYYDSAGTNWLWYPGNRASLPGRYKVEGRNICLQYGPNTYNPVTGSRGAVWECQSVAYLQRAIVETAQGDVFHLAGGAIPFVLAPERTTMDALRQQASNRPAPARHPPARRSRTPAAPSTSLSN